MKVIVILVAFVGFGFGAAVPVDQPQFFPGFLHRQNDSVRIVGGEATTIENFPWVVILDLKGRPAHCAAIIISPNRCLSAAHCTINRPASSFQIRAGSTNRQVGGQIVDIAKIINHPEYNTPRFNNDISVLWIVGSFNTSLPGISVISMPDQGAVVSTGAMANVTGWGSECFGCPGSNILRFVAVPIVSNKQCKADYADLTEITDGMLCAGFREGGRDACAGDSGGLLNIGSTLVGIVSWGQGCARPNRPGVYARVAVYRYWIDSNM